MKYLFSLFDSHSFAGELLGIVRNSKIRNFRAVDLHAALLYQAARFLFGGSET